MLPSSHDRDEPAPRRLSETATIPVRGSAQAAGYDLQSAYDATIPAGGKALVKTDIAVAVPEGHYGAC